MGRTIAAAAVCVLFCSGCADGAARPATYAEACAVPGSEGIDGEARPGGGDVWVAEGLPLERVREGFEAWSAASGGAVRWRVRRAEGDAIRYGAVNVFACPADAPRFVTPEGDRAGGATSGDAVALSADWLGSVGLEALAAHEAGHALGLHDSGAPGDVMNPYETALAPSPGDLAALASLSK